MQLTEQEIVRREKLVKLRALGIDPYPAALYPVNTMSTAIEKYYKEGKQVIVSGRLMRKKVQGKASFGYLTRWFIGLASLLLHWRHRLKRNLHLHV